MLYRALADAVVVLHLAFVAFVVLGGFLALRWRRVALAHLPCAAWGALVELAGWVCPLTPLENGLRQRAGQAGYAGGFVEHYLLPLLYPEPFPRGLALFLGGLVLTVNAAAYALVLRRASAGVPTATGVRPGGEKEDERSGHGHSDGVPTPEPDGVSGRTGPGDRPRLTAHGNVGDGDQAGRPRPRRT